MTLKDLMKVLPAYATVYVHDEDHTFAHKGNPHQFTLGIYQNICSYVVTMAVPLDSYTIEITIKKENKKTQWCTAY